MEALSFRDRGPFITRLVNRSTRVYGKTEPVPVMGPHGLKMVRSTLEIGLMITQMERGPIFFPMGLNTREDSSVVKNMAKEPSKKPMDSSVMMVNGRMVKGLEEGGSTNGTARATKGIGWMVSLMATECSPIPMDGFTLEP